MGCTNSRMNSVEAVPEKIRPFLVRRYEEIKKRRQRSSSTTMQKESTMSNKKLLKEDEEIGSSSSNNEGEAESKPEAVKVEPIINNKVAPLPESDTQHVAIITDAENNDDNTKQTVQEKNEEEEKDDTQKTEETVSKNEDEKVDDTDDDSDDYDSADRIICPGSPSFKIYCTPPQNNKEEKNSQQEIDTKEKSASVESLEEPASGHVKAPSADSIHSASSSHNSNEVAETQTASKKRKNRKMSFRAVKNILVVKSLYTSCAGNSDRTRLVAAKTTKAH